MSNVTGRKFSLVDGKVAEAEFFLRKISEVGLDFFVARCYVSAFVNSMRTVTYAIQAVLKNQEGFEEWYGKHQTELKQNPICRFFHNFRRVDHHVGENVVQGGSMNAGVIQLWFGPTTDIPEVPTEDAVTCCKRYFINILHVVFDCYAEFGFIIDARQYYTAEHFASISKTIEDAEEELGFPRGWTNVFGAGEEEKRWCALRRDIVGCEINHIFSEYIEKTI